jgi:hypothetical protein
VGVVFSVPRARLPAGESGVAAASFAASRLFSRSSRVSTADSACAPPFCAAALERSSLSDSTTHRWRLALVASGREKRPLRSLGERSEERHHTRRQNGPVKSWILQVDGEAVRCRSAARCLQGDSAYPIGMTAAGDTSTRADFGELSAAAGLEARLALGKHMR